MVKKEEIIETIKLILKGISVCSMSLVGLLLFLMLFLSRMFESFYSDLWCDQCTVEPKARAIYILLVVTFLSETITEFLSPDE